MAGLGMVLPLPGGIDTVVAPHSLAFAIASGGDGGGWPPTLATLADFAVLVLTLLVLAGALLGLAAWTALWAVGQKVAAMSMAEAAAGGAASLGASIAVAVTGGHDMSLGYHSFRDAAWRGAAQGALTGALSGLLILAGAAVLGVG